MTVKEYKIHKKLPAKSKANHRDHMNDFELIFNMLGEKTTTEITRERNSNGFGECKNSANQGGKAANEARKSFEKQLGKSIISKDNFLPKKKVKKSYPSHFFFNSEKVPSTIDSLIWSISRCIT